MLIDLITKEEWNHSIRIGCIDDWNKRFKPIYSPILHMHTSGAAFRIRIYNSNLDKFSKRLDELKRKPKIFYLKVKDTDKNIDTFVKAVSISKSKSVHAKRNKLNYYCNITMIVVPVNNLEVLSYINKLNLKETK